MSRNGANLEKGIGISYLDLIGGGMDRFHPLHFLTGNPYINFRPKSSSVSTSAIQKKIKINYS
jgi:hypothetical protein